MVDVFISYKSEDRKRVGTLVASLRRSGLGVWWDQDIPEGADWEESITGALTSARCVIVCWSRLSIQSRVGRKVQVEAREAEEQGKLLQVLLDRVNPPLFFRQSQAANLSDWSGDEQDARYQKLAQAARDILDGVEPAAFEPVSRRGRISIGAAIASLSLVCLLALGAAMLVSPTVNTLVYAAMGRFQHAFVSKPGDPVIVGIYPTDAFGPDHKQGLATGLAPFAQDLRIIHLEAPYSLMKADQADRVLENLRRLIIHENVVAVVGPPVTEFSRSVIREVERTGLPTPIFITSATSRDADGWEEAKVPLFRINSGVDERAHEFVGLARAAIEAGVPLVFLVETHSNVGERTYGQILFDRIADEIPEWPQWVGSGLVTQRGFTRGEIVEEVAQWDAGEFLARRQIIMLLGVGSDYKALADGYYRADQPARVSLLGGWMNAYEVHRAYRERGYQWSRLFEVTDMHFQSARLRESAQKFLREIGAPSPAVRDQAFSYDAANTIAAAVLVGADAGSIASLRTTRSYLAALAGKLRQTRATGVTGDIRFDGRGQNAGAGDQGLMTYAQFDGAQWQAFDDVQGVIDLLNPPPPEP